MRWRAVRTLRARLALGFLFNVIPHIVRAHDQNALLWEFPIWDILKHETSSAGHIEQIRIPYVPVNIERFNPIQNCVAISITDLKIMEGCIFHIPFPIGMQGQSGKVIIVSEGCGSLGVPYANLMDHCVTSNETHSSSYICNVKFHAYHLVPVIVHDSLVDVLQFGIKGERYGR